MKKLLTFGCPLALAVAGAGWLRAWQRRADFDADGLLTRGPASVCLVILALVAAVGFGLLSHMSLTDVSARRLKEQRKMRGYLSAFALPHKALIVVYLMAGGLLLAAGLLGIRDHQAGLNVRTSYYIFSIALVPTGLDLALVGWLNAQKEEAQGRFAWPLLLPGWCGCIWLIAAYQSQTAQPNPMAYGLYFLGALSAVGGSYMMAAFSFERSRSVPCAWLSAMGLILLATAVVDGYVLKDTPQMLTCLGYMVYLAVQLKCLLYRSAVPADLIPWEPAEDEIPDSQRPDHEKTEVSEDE